MFQLADLAFVRADDGRAVRVHDAVKKLADLLFHGDLFQFERRTAFFAFVGAAVPQIAEHGGRKLDEFARGRERVDKSFQRVFDLRPRHGLAVAGASVLAAHVIGIATANTLGPSGGHGMVAIAASDEAAHREIRVDVFAGRRVGVTRQTLLNEIERFERDQSFMLRFAQRQVPARHFDVPRIERLRQDLIGAFVGHQPLPVFGEHVCFEEAFDFRLRAEAA